MGQAHCYKCEACGAPVEHVVDDFDYGFSAHVTTPVLCAAHGVLGADTGLMAWDDGWELSKAGAYPCPVCGEVSPIWDRKTCPVCGKKRVKVDSSYGPILWD